MDRDNFDLHRFSIHNDRRNLGRFINENKLNKIMNSKKVINFLKREKIIIILLFLLTITIRILFKNGGLYHWDSLKDVIVIEEMLKTGEIQYSYAYGAPGMVAFVFIFYWLAHLITGTTSAEGTYFFVTFLTTGLAVALTYILVKKITKDKFISISSALLLCFNAVFLSVTTYPKTHSISLFFILSSLLLLFLFNKKQKWWIIVLSGLFFGLAVAVRILNIFMILPLIFIYLNPQIKESKVVIKKYKLQLKYFAYFLISSIGIWYTLFSKKISTLGGIIPYLNSLLTEQGAAVRWQGLISGSMTTGLNHIYKSISIAGIILLIIGIFYSIKNYKKLLILLSLWIIPSFLYFANIGNPEARFFIIIFPAISILMGVGLRYIYKKNSTLGILSLIITIILMFSTAYPIISHRHEYSGTKELALWVEKNTEENSIIISNDIGFFIEYYGHRERIVSPRTGNNEDINKFIDKLLSLSQEDRPIYTTGEGLAIDPGQKVLAKIQENFNIALIGEVESEIYQFSELELKPYKESLYKLTPK